MTAHRTTTHNSVPMRPAQPLILVVEDDPALRVFLADLLDGEGYRPRCVASGTQALQALAEDTPDLVLLDLCLPDLDGYAVSQRIRESAQRHVPILMVSANRDPRDVLEALHVGVDDYLRKPFDVVELLAQIRAHLPLVLPVVEDEAVPGRIDLAEPLPAAPLAQPCDQAA
ncbi:MAG TPA: response regulator transcription factor [Herpetosiphonaceae bacterium]